MNNLARYFAENCKQCGTPLEVKNDNNDRNDNIYLSLLIIDAFCVNCDDHSKLHMAYAVDDNGSRLVVV